MPPEYGFTVRLKLDEFNNAKFRGHHARELRGHRRGHRFLHPFGGGRRTSSGSAALGVNMVVGTTGWLGEMDRVKSAVARNGIGLVWSPNYSVGVNVFFRLVAEAARLLRQDRRTTAPGPGRSITAAKKDAPSGTLLKLVER